MANKKPILREKETRKFFELVKLKESFQVVGDIGMGKSKFLREMDEKNTSDSKLVYFDLNQLYKKDLQTFVEIFSKLLHSNENSLAGIEKKIEEYLGDYKSLYIMFDDIEVMNDCDKEVVNTIRSLRDNFKYKLCYVFGFRTGQEPDIRLSQLLTMAPYKLKLETLDNEEMKKTISYLAVRYNLKLNKKETDQIIKLSKGNPSNCKKLLLKKHFGEDLLITETDKDEKILEKAIMEMSKSEYLIFKKLIESKGKLVEKDDIAEILSPQSHGSGVSDAAISQIVKRVREACDENEINLVIKTKRGMGYYLV
ncbi:hypothetical protein A3D91_03720 [candidate division WWE3 bacterium RIFCSPHIGHO2_02_FULL_38_14]|uniref:OmpR/PhoB-type domain-containing protein n=1 Tax=candidate division WWE3 bacterium RIFCSPHIGHO2_02_FULL_38_14 TaxID=1802620 RepID=A0A1F4V9H7_UNCKA|nr:MAG: hypothetical protein A3D91_03720 [candidate division WWE3 bacterium RIFCSPHIGHO2_02_FULL_38_14]